ncbi:histidine phosphatase family protein [Mycoplana dimorpha]|uniref:Broad specificity phosphatase PhoE n=1 Tax=Mycoplana dimorpha TaxID=28320 RepID=A0A2T5BB45_MYCDI|nr:histidine phosphatase family protein [Mycoplana dimorpha]PTM96153.1 broad specificity phosphatase PhoE [Mycoplana dimorpha]
MTTTFFLVRHAAHDDVGRFLAGRADGVALSEPGRAQARRLGTRMAREDFSTIYASPRQRAQQTAAAIAAANGGGPVRTADELDEVDFGHWSGKTFDILNGDPGWRRWNSLRSLARTPGGETMLNVQQRAFAFIETLAADPGDRRLVLVSHADVIKSVVSHVLGLPADAWPRFDVAPASVTTVVLGEWGAKVLTLNEIIP